jgi:hypothetical protein
VVLNSMPRAAVKERILLKAMVRFGWGVVDRQSRAAPFTPGAPVIPGVPCREVTRLGDNDNHSSNSNSNSDSNSNNNSNSNSVREEQERERDSKDDEIASRVIAQLPYSTRSLWVSSYQSWLWNNVASHRLMSTSNAAAANPSSGEGSNTQTYTGSGTDSSGGTGENGKSVTCADSCDSGGNGDIVSLISEEDRGAMAAVEGLQAMVGDLVHSSCLSSLSLSHVLFSLQRDPPTGPDRSNCASASVSDHALTRTGHSHDDTLPVYVPLPTSDDPVIALTVAHISSLSAVQRGYLFRNSVLLPLFGKKILFPENATGRYCSDFHVTCPVHPNLIRILNPHAYLLFLFLFSSCSEIIFSPRTPLLY